MGRQKSVYWIAIIMDNGMGNCICFVKCFPSLHNSPCCSMFKCGREEGLIRRERADFLGLLQQCVCVCVKIRSRMDCVTVMYCNTLPRVILYSGPLSFCLNKIPSSPFDDEIYISLSQLFILWIKLTNKEACKAKLLSWSPIITVVVII